MYERPSTAGVSRRNLLKAAGLVGGTFPISALTGCGGGDSRASGGAPGQHTIIAGGSSTGASGVYREALRMAAEKQGYVARLEELAQDAAVLAVRSGKTNAALMSWVNIAQAQEAGAPVVAIAPAWASHNAIIVRPDSPYQSIEDLVGKRVGFPARTSGGYFETREALMEQGLDPEKEFKLTSLADAAVMLGLFEKGEFEAVALFEPLVSKILSQGKARELIQIGTWQASRRNGVMAPANCWAVRRDWAQQQDPAKLTTIFTEATRTAATDPAPYQVAGKAAGLDAKAIQLFQQRLSRLAAPSLTDAALKYVQAGLDHARRDGLITKAVTVDSLLLAS
ncbi:ABC transporter substrate-binding protein [Micromonospora sp. NPDC048830]|uniref:ABC transporter substrate-binding protein n=1 Tax=Micromonospora sp. NPDC048830 TaxID=3364257 RepID=UPI0037156069